MGMDLRRLKDSAYFRWSAHHWGAVLEMAKRNGWIPMGTVLGDDYYHSRGYCSRNTFTQLDATIRFNEDKEKWDGSYIANRKQEIKKEDASNLADALQKGLPDIPDRKAVKHKKAIDMPEIMTIDEFCDSISNATKTGIIEDGEMILGGGYTAEQWQSLNIYERLAGLQKKLKDFIKFLKVDGCSIH